MQFSISYALELHAHTDMNIPGGGGVTLIFSYIRRLGSFFGVQNLNFNIFFLVFRKINTLYIWGMKILWIFLGGHHKIGLYLVVISMHFRVFS